jgi:hypothetical protein
MSHTEGKLTVHNAMRIKDENGVSVATLAISPNSDEISEANARRLVACWNACAGIPTDALETHDIFCAQTNVGLKNTELKQERDEALDVLRTVGSDIATTIYRLDKETEACVNAILAKHQKVTG